MLLFGNFASGPVCETGVCVWKWKIGKEAELEFLFVYFLKKTPHFSCASANIQTAAFFRGKIPYLSDTLSAITTNLFLIYKKGQAGASVGEEKESQLLFLLLPSTRVFSFLSWEIT